MSSVQQLVEEFHRVFVPEQSSDYPNITSETIKQVRIKLIQEEYFELLQALLSDDLIEIADGLADLTYVIYGTAICYGIDLDEVIKEVHRSNMSKLGEDGKPILRADGKVLKGPNYSPPNITKILGVSHD